MELSNLIYKEDLNNGATGPAGGAATLAVGTTTTGEPGTTATVTNTGTSEAAIFDFTIPQGPTGPAGEVGATGPTGPTERLFKSSNKIIIDSS